MFASTVVLTVRSLSTVSVLVAFLLSLMFSNDYVTLYHWHLQYTVSLSIALVHVLRLRRFHLYRCSVTAQRNRSKHCVPAGQEGTDQQPCCDSLPLTISPLHSTKHKLARSDTYFYKTCTNKDQ